MLRLLLTNVRKLAQEAWERYQESREGIDPLTVLDRLRALGD